MLTTTPTIHKRAIGHCVGSVSFGNNKGADLLFKGNYQSDSPIEDHHLQAAYEVMLHVRNILSEENGTHTLLNGVPVDHKGYAYTITDWEYLANQAGERLVREFHFTLERVDANKPILLTDQLNTLFQRWPFTKEEIKAVFDRVAKGPGDPLEKVENVLRHAMENNTPLMDEAKKEAP